VLIKCVICIELGDAVYTNKRTRSVQKEVGRLEIWIGNSNEISTRTKKSYCVKDEWWS